MRLYIAGPVTGIPDYKERFNAAEAELKEKGHTVLNPAILPDGLTHAQHMTICLPMLDVCEGILLLDGWQHSKGAMMEYNRAIATEKTRFYSLQHVHTVTQAKEW